MLELNTIHLGDSYELLKKYEIHNNAILVIDPPYNVNYKYNSYKDNLSMKEYIEKMKEITSYFKQFVIINYPENLYHLSIKLKKAPTKVVSWVYNSNNARQHRDIAFYGIEPNFEAVRQPYKNLNDKRIQERIANGSGGGRLYDWWKINQVKNVSSEKYNHPCQIPIKVMLNIIGILPKESVIYDVFSGSGTTCIACKELERKFVGIEIDPLYHQISLDRLNGITAQGQTSIFTDFEDNTLIGVMKNDTKI